MLTVPIILIFLNLAVDARTDSKENFRTVLTSTGRVIGTYKYYRDNIKLIEIVEYLGIPYATPPVEDLRFKPPQPPEIWVGVLNATQTKPPCAQMSYVPHEKKKMFIGDEDCLYLNIYVPQILNNTELMPVLIWIHGGSFQHGTGTDVKGKYLMKHEIVFVTINYRLGPFGFLSTEDNIVPGNMGLKDQSMALRWVSKNIMSFQGDPSRITLIGLDAGGASVHYHYLSKLSTGLFQGGISMSGTAFNTWALTKKPLEKTKVLAKLLLCPTNGNKDMIKCLKKVPASVMVEATVLLIPYATNSYVTFGPVVEISGDLAFIDKLPYEIINKREVQDLPWITGVVEADGLYFSSELASSNYLVNTLDFYWEDIIPQLLEFRESVATDMQPVIAFILRSYYFGNEEINKKENFVKKFVEMTTDRLFKVDSMVAATMQARANYESVWYYNYRYRGKLSTCDIIYNIKENYGPCHGDDAYYVMDDIRFNPQTFDSYAMQQRMIDFVLNFVKDKVPRINSIKWDRLYPYQQKFEYLDFEDPYNIYINGSINFGNIDLWKYYHLYSKYF